MKKTCGGFVLSLAGFYLLGSSLFGGFSGSVMAQEIPSTLKMPAATAVESEGSESPEPASPVSIEEPSTRLPVAERMAVLKTADLETLKAAQDECMSAAQELSVKGPILRKQISEAYEAAKSLPEAVALQKQIKDLEKKWEQTLQESPAVQEKIQELEETNDEMMQELKLRTTLAGWISSKGAAPEQISE